MTRIITYQILLISVLVFIAPVCFAQGYGVKTIVIDAGHGGRDPGAVGKRAKEKDIALNVALLTGKYIKQYLPDVKVVYTRKTDVFLQLRERTKIAQDANADLFVSIHVNALGNPSVYGSSTWVLGLHRSDDNLKVAQKENAVIQLEENYEENYKDFDPNDPNSYIIFNYVNSQFLKQSMELAAIIQKQFKTRVGRKDRGVEQAGFLVLRETSMPSVLVELGFITNRKEEEYLIKKNNQEYMASAIFRAIRDYKTKIDAAEQDAVVETKPEPKREVVSTATADEIVFRLQIITSKKKLSTDNKPLKGLKDVWEYKSGSYYKYTVGKSTNIKDISQLQKTYRNQFKDAFVVAFKNNKRIPVGKAKQELKTR